MPNSTPRPHLLVLNQYYHPGVEATAHLLTELCEALATSWQVTVITGRLRDHEDEPDYEVKNGVEIIRLHSTAYDRAPLHRRAINYFTYLGRALFRGVRMEPPDVVLCMTDPPLVGNVAWLVARRFRRPLIIISQDVFPEIAVQLRRLQNPVLIVLLRLLIGQALRRADRVVAIGPMMRERLVAKGASPERTVVIPNWVDSEAIRPRPKDNAWTREHALQDRFVVMHSGNVGHAQNLDTLVRAAALLRDLEALAVVIIGTGARHAELTALAQQVGATNVMFLPYEPRARLSESLSGADLHFVGLPKGLAGYVVPSRVYGILAAGRAVLAAVDADSETAELVRRVGCGVVVDPGDVNAVAATIRELSERRDELGEMGVRGREWVDAAGGKSAAVGAYSALIAEARGSV